MHQLRYFTAGFVAALGVVCGSARPEAQAQPEPAPGEATYVVFMSGREVGREQVSLSRTESGWRIASSGRIVAPVNLTNTRFEVTYAADWQPLRMRLDAQVQDRDVHLSTTFEGTTARNELTQDGVTNTESDEVSARTIVLPSSIYAAYEALAVRLAASVEGAALPVYIAPQTELTLTVNSVTPVTYQTPSGTVNARRYSVTFQNPNGPVQAQVTVDDRSRFARADFGRGVLAIAREDLAGVSTRQQTYRNPTDVDVRIPASGFSLAGTITTPPKAGATTRVRYPAVVLIGGLAQPDRDTTSAGVPLFAQLAGELAAAGHVVLRYDRRGVGQSGGRTETVTLQEYAEDAKAAVRFMRRRRDVDDDRVFVVGHGEGAAIAMLTGREKAIAGLVLIGGMGTTGRELILEQQRHALNAANVVGPERAERIELQEQILEAAVQDSGWEDLPAGVRPLVDTPLYRSLVLFDPAEVMPRVRQPVLIIHGGEDAEVPPRHAERLAELARARGDAPPVEVRRFPALDHHLVPASDSETPSGEPRGISPEISRTIAAWIATVAR